MRTRAMSSEKNIIFWDSDDFEYPYEISQKDTSDKRFVKVQVIAGSWILYEKKGFNADGGSAKHKIVNPGQVETLTEFSPGSFWRAVDERDCVVLFEHPGYAGKRKQYKRASPDITKDFPTHAPGGVSSFIIWPSKKWEMCHQKNFGAPSKMYNSGWYDYEGKDKVVSMRPV